MFNFIFLNYFQKQLAFCVLMFIITKFSISQANTATDYNSNDIYKNKIYSDFRYININSDISIMLYGIGMESTLHNKTEILCSYATGNLRLKKIKEQKSADKSHSVTLALKQHYNNFLLQYDFSYVHIASTFKILQNNIYYNIAGDVNTTIFAINLGKKFKINHNLYLIPQCSVGFDKVHTKIKIKITTAPDLKKESATFHGFIIIPELVIGSNFFLTNIKINPEISFSYLFDTSECSNNKINIKPKIIMDINRLYIAIEARSITESHGRSLSLKLGLLF